MSRIFRKADDSAPVDLMERATQSISGVKYLHISQLNVDHRYQRAVNPLHVRKIVNDFSENLLGVILVHRRDNGLYFVVDGQHRVEALREMFGSHRQVLAEIAEGLTFEEEAQLFAALNTQRKAVGAIALWWALLEAGDEETLAIKTVLDRYQIRVIRDGENAKGPRKLAAIGAVRIVAGLGIDHLDRVLRIIVTSWNNDDTALQHDVIRGMSAFVRRFGNLIDDERLIEKLSHEGLVSVRQRTRSLKTGLHMSPTRAFGEALKASHDYKRRGENKLPEW